jgi:hypothetical protein
VTCFSERLYGSICKFCVHGQGEGCVRDVPWYAVSIHCKFFKDGEPIVAKAHRRRGLNLKKVLVDTF